MKIFVITKQTMSNLGALSAETYSFTNEKDANLEFDELQAAAEQYLYHTAEIYTNKLPIEIQVERLLDMSGQFTGCEIYVAGKYWELESIVINFATIEI